MEAQERQDRSISTYDPQVDKWSDATRDLIKHGNELVAQRLSAMGTFQGFLFAALSYSWDRSRWLSLMRYSGSGMSTSRLSAAATRLPLSGVGLGLEAPAQRLSDEFFQGMV
jgi:hypothetical protein